jgi:hypothetical protein
LLGMSGKFPPLSYQGSRRGKTKSSLSSSGTGENLEPSMPSSPTEPATMVPVSAVGISESPPLAIAVSGGGLEEDEAIGRKGKSAVREIS